MSTRIITSREGDTLSSIAYEHYGSSTRQVECILQANPKLARQPAVLPAGVQIVLPAAPTAPAVSAVRTITLLD